MRDDFQKTFDPLLWPALRAAGTSPHPAMKHLIANLERFVVVAGEDLDIQEKLTETKNGIVIGYSDADFLPDGTPIVIDKKIATGGVLIVGSVGSGKSNLVSGCGNQATSVGITSWWVTRKKEHIHRARDEGTLLITPGKFPHNPLRSPKFSEGWISNWCEVFGSTKDLAGVSTSFLSRAIKETMQKFAREHPDLKCPSLFEVRITFSDLKKNIAARDRPKAEYAARGEDRIDGFLDSKMGQDCITYDGPDLGDLLFRNVVFDISDLSLWDAAYWVNFWLTYRLVALMSMHHLVQEADHFIMIDEGEEFLLRTPGVSNISFVSRYFNLFRELGTSLWVTSHSHEALRSLPFLTNNCAAIVMLPMGSLSDALGLGRAMGIEDTDLIKELELGKAIVKLVNVSRPIPLRIPKLDINRVVTHEEVKEFDRRTQEFISRYDIHYVPLKERAFVFDEMLQRSSESRTAGEVVRDSAVRNDNFVKEFCTAIHVSPDKRAISIKKKLSFGSSNEMFNTTKNSALQSDLIFEVKRAFDETGSGRPPSRFSLLTAGYNLIGGRPRGEGKGELQRLFRNFVKSVYEARGFMVDGEDFSNRADLYVRKPDGGILVAVEITLSTPIPHELKNIARDLGEGSGAVLVVVVQLLEEKDRKNVYLANRVSEENKAQALKNAIEENFGGDDRIQVRTFEEFRLNE